MLSRKTKHLLLKIISMFSVVRGYNIPVIVLAQYLSSIFILAPEKRALEVILDKNLFLIVLLSSLTIASGYIINNFYDSKKDLINRPNKSMLDRLVSQKTKLQVYFSINFIVFILAFFVSIRAVLFFSCYIFLIWFYSHKLKKIAIIGNLTASLLAVLPFFAILLYFKNFYNVIFAHATFLYLLILIREMIKDLENIKGDIANDYQTIPVIFGENFSKKTITFLTISTIIPVYFLIEIFEVGYMDIYFYISMIILIFFLQKLWKSETKSDYLKLHNILKFIVVSGVFCIILINLEVLIHGKKVVETIVR
ncbi:MAG: geranylgeranylglycerol-phosphate geranylgeranyltransferase [Flavobacterium sp.]|jgi:4-hydroxybenzoate polyprenyltransferase|uniref:Geranylgeranylglycerol-phosphate geranylgeranyltransferase n=1 Tax=Flavobacterium macrobrachii TaxID=591204 RepID=A0ABS2CZ37_9FLAO|nr:MULTISPECIES: geranylgeranylglycerol-phosphate geranylgeranyltransferase [Flavobacterium]MBM6500242.1 geranylgeranylglycerol-phosphate geranylgeranyltransferase [Flavobacterium macrobrachii]MCZ8330986.1 geranylgeranylglycerol-phosphate geranylgeranyltransferase [Flavobacterium sp.]PZO31548.1 MAG: ubiquinone biosynthesis protein UbiA [Flavobacteriaceae bacterium]